MESEDKRDFELLNRRLSATTWSAQSSSSSVRTINSSEIYPLNISANFVDHYIVGDVVGTGSYAEVRECINTKSLERCALKIINKDYLRRQAPRALSNQLQEIRLLRHLSHPNIISMRDCLFKQSQIYMVLEFCSFVLSDLISLKNDDSLVGDQLGSHPSSLDDQITLTLSVTRNLFHQLCSGIGYLHSLGIVHRDIKPQNLLITNCGVLKIIDLGVCQVLSMWSSDDESYAIYEGSPLFQAPEIVCSQRKRRHSNFQVDVWSAGVTLYLMLFNQFPFYDESLLGLYDSILSKDFSIPDSMCCNQVDVVTDLLAMMLEKQSDKRATIDQVLGHPWLLLDSNHECDDEDHVEFIDFVLAAQSAARARRRAEPTEPDELGASRRAIQTDVYRSTNVLPYLYKHHYPHLAVNKARRPPKTRGQAEEVAPNSALFATLTLGSGSQATSASPSPSPSGSASGASKSSSPEQSDEESSNPNKIIHDQDEVEWGTREQFNLMKVPPIRANRQIDVELRHKRRLERRRRRRKRRQRRVRHEGQQQESRPNGASSGG